MYLPVLSDLQAFLLPIAPFGECAVRLLLNNVGARFLSPKCRFLNIMFRQHRLAQVRLGTKTHARPLGLPGAA